MRRPREIGMVAGLLLGLSGCAGLPGQANYRAAADRSSVFERAEGRFSRIAAFWRRPEAEVLEDEEPADAAARPVSARSAPLVVRNEKTESAGTAEESSSRPRLFRHFPRLSRLWKRAGTGTSDSNALGASDERASAPMERTASARAQRDRSPAARTASSRPTSARRPAERARSSAPSRDLAFDWPARGNRPQVDPATVPARNSNSGPEARPLEPSLNARLIARSPQDAPSAKPGAAPNLAPPDDLPVPNLPTTRPAEPTLAPLPAPARAPAPAPPASAAQPVPQPTLPKENQPAPSSTNAGEHGPTIASEPASEEDLAPQSQAQAPSGQVWSTWPSSPMPVEQHDVVASAQSYVPTSGCVDSCAPKCKVRHKLCPFKKHKMVDPCDCAAPVKVKKPCFLKRWLHRKTCTDGACGCAAVVDDCGAQGPIAIASPQEVVAPAPSGQW